MTDSIKQKHMNFFLILALLIPSGSTLYAQIDSCSLSFSHSEIILQVESIVSSSDLEKEAIDLPVLERLVGNKYHLKIGDYPIVCRGFDRLFSPNYSEIEIWVQGFSCEQAACYLESKFSTRSINGKLEWSSRTVEYEVSYTTDFLLFDLSCYMEAIERERAEEQAEIARRRSIYGQNSYQTPTSSSSPRNRTSRSTPRRTINRRYIRGPRGGCYYINSNGNKTYVSRSLCN